MKFPLLNVPCLLFIIMITYSSLVGLLVDGAAADHGITVGVVPVGHVVCVPGHLHSADGSPAVPLQLGKAKRKKKK